MLDDLIKNLRKEFGAETIVSKAADIEEVIPTGSINLDLAIGVGGFPVGRICEIIGAESSGKSTLCISAATMAQKMGRGVVYLDAENSFQPTYAKALGLNVTENNFLLIQPNTAEEGLEIIEIAVQDKNVGLVILDSVAAMVPSKESYDHGEIGDIHVGLVARLMTQFIRRITPIMKNKARCSLLMVNQLRDNIGGGPFSAPQTPGGRALKYAASVRVKLGRKSTVKDTADNTSIVIAAQVIKNKVAPPYADCEFNIRLGKGIDTTLEIAEILIADGFVKKAGSWYKDASGNNLGQGISSVATWINQNPKIVANLLMEKGVRGIYVE